MSIAFLLLLIIPEILEFKELHTYKFGLVYKCPNATLFSAVHEMIQSICVGVIHKHVR